MHRIKRVNIFMASHSVFTPRTRWRIFMIEIKNFNQTRIKFLICFLFLLPCGSFYGRMSNKIMTIFSWTYCLSLSLPLYRPFIWEFIFILNWHAEWRLIKFIPDVARIYVCALYWGNCLKCSPRPLNTSKENNTKAFQSGDLQ